MPDQTRSKLVSLQSTLSCIIIVVSANSDGIHSHFKGRFSCFVRTYCHHRSVVSVSFSTTDFAIRLKEDEVEGGVSTSSGPPNPLCSADKYLPNEACPSLFPGLIHNRHLVPKEQFQFKEGK